MKNINDIMHLVPHRYPFLLIDRILQVDGDQAIKVLKNVTINEAIFTGHFPEYPVMPGVLILEAMAQAAVALVAIAFGEEQFKNKLVFLTSIEKATFTKQVIPGDSMILDVKKVRARMNLWIMEGETTVNGAKVATAQFSAMIADKVSA